MINPPAHPPVRPAANPLWIAAARNAALAALAFCLAVSGILINIYRQDRRDNPLAPEALAQLKVDLAGNPGDEQLKQKIRQADQALRQSHLQRRARLARGAYLLLGGAVVLLVCARHALRAASDAADPLHLPPPVDPLSQAPLARRSIATAAVVCGAALAAAALSPAPQYGPAATAQRTADLSWPADEELLSNWPCFRGSSAGVAAGSQLPPRWDGAANANILWKSPVPLPGRNSPIVWDSRVFLSGATDGCQEIYCWDARTGSLLWRKAVGTPIPARAPTLAADTGSAPSTTVTDGRRVVAIFPTGDMAAADYSGRVLWSRNLGALQSQYGHASSLAIWRDRVIVQLDQGLEPEEGKSALLAVNSADGRTIWKTPRPVANSWSSPLVLLSSAAGPMVVTAARPWVIAYETEHGTELWRAKCLEGDVAPSPASANGLIFVAQEGARLSAIRLGGSGDVTASHIAWSADNGLPDTVSPLATSQFVFLTTSFGIVTCFDAATGHLLWEHDFSVAFHASPIAISGVVHLVDRDGITHRFKASAGFEPLDDCPLGEPVSATPAVQGNRLYIRGEQNLYCIGTQ